MDDLATVNQGESLKLKSLEKELEDIKQKAKIEYQGGQTTSPIREGGLRSDIFPLIYDKEPKEKEEKSEQVSKIESPNLPSKVPPMPVKPTYLEKENLDFTTRLGEKSEAQLQPTKSKLQIILWAGIVLMTLSIISLAVHLLV